MPTEAELLEIAERDGLFTELFRTIHDLQHWSEMPVDYYEKLGRWVTLDKPLRTFNAAYPRLVTTEQGSKKDRTEDNESTENAKCYLILVFELEESLHKCLNVEAMISLLEKTLNDANVHAFALLHQSYIGEFYHEYKTLLATRLDACPGRVSNHSKAGSPALQAEQQRAYSRVIAVMENHPFWVGSLSDFVHTIDTLVTNGFLRANELEEALAESFMQKPTSKSKPQKLTAEKIKGRRRSIDSGRHTPSPEVKKTVDKLIETMPSKRKG